MSLTRDEEIVTQAIISAFSDTSYPRDDYCTKPNAWDEEKAQVAQLTSIANCGFTAYGYEYVPKAYGWMTPEAFRYFIPGYMLHVIRLKNESDANLTVDPALLPGKTNGCPVTFS